MCSIGRKVISGFKPEIEYIHTIRMHQSSLPVAESRLYIRYRSRNLYEMLNNNPSCFTADENNDGVVCKLKLHLHLLSSAN